MSEEAGLRVRIGARIGDIGYSFTRPNGGAHCDKTVTFFLMAAVGGDVSRHDAESNFVERVKLRDTLGHLTYMRMKRESWKRLLAWPKAKTSQERNLRIIGRLTVLREKRLDDAEADFRWRIDPELAELDATVPLRLTFREYLRYFGDELEYPSPWSVRLAVETKDGVHIGNVMYYDIDESRKQTEFGIMIGDRRYWNRSYGSDVILTLMRHIFRNTPIERVYLHTLLWNGRAQAAFRKCGFREVNHVRRDGHDFLLMDIWRESWITAFGLEDSAAGSDGQVAEEQRSKDASSMANDGQTTTG